MFTYYKHRLLATACYRVHFALAAGCKTRNHITDSSSAPLHRGTKLLLSLSRSLQAQVSHNLFDVTLNLTSESDFRWAPDFSALRFFALSHLFGY